MSFLSPPIVLIPVSLAAAGLLGFAAHRASFCSVKAVSEILSSRRAYMLASFMKITIWVLAIALPLAWLGPTVTTAAQTWAFGWPAIAGGILFGVGATINGGCAFYTLTRLTSGSLALLFTLAGFIVGYVLQSSFFDGFQNQTASATIMLYDRPRLMSLVVLVFVWILFLVEIRRLWCSSRHRSLRDRLLAKRYRLSSAAVIFGFSNGLLFVFWGPWAYTSALHQQVVDFQSMSVASHEIKLGLFAAVLIGMILSSWQRGDGHISWGTRSHWMVHLTGGTLMGTGAAIAPGGNDALLLYGVPMFSPHALPALAAMFLAIAVTLQIGKVLAGRTIRTNCEGDICRIDRSNH